MIQYPTKASIDSAIALQLCRLQLQKRIHDVVREYMLSICAQQIELDLSDKQRKEYQRGYISGTDAAQHGGAPVSAGGQVFRLGYCDGYFGRDRRVA